MLERNPSRTVTGAAAAALALPVPEPLALLELDEEHAAAPATRRALPTTAAPPVKILRIVLILHRLSRLLSTIHPTCKLGNIPDTVVTGQTRMVSVWLSAQPAARELGVVRGVLQVHALDGGELGQALLQARDVGGRRVGVDLVDDLGHRRLHRYPGGYRRRGDVG